MKARYFMILWCGAVCLHATLAAADTPQQYLQAGNDLFRKQAFDQAIFSYTKALDIDPNLAKAYNNRGVAYAREGSLNRAVDDFTMAIAVDPKDEEAYNNRGHAHAASGNWIQAIMDYSKAISLNAFYVKAYDNRKMAYFQLKDYDKAWDDVFKIEELGGHVDRDFYLSLLKASRQ